MHKRPRSPFSPSIRAGVRPCVQGKFIWVGDEKLYVRGVTYGTFRPDADGNDYLNPKTVGRDFALMVGAGINAVRVYTVPPLWFLDLAQEWGVRVLVAVPWEQHVTFLDERTRVRSIRERVRHGVRACAGHPALLCYAVGNEIPAPIVRWHGHRRVEAFIRELYFTGKEEDPDGLFTYVNYPTTEYLQLPFLDLVCMNVYLESQEGLQAYLARLQNIAGDRPLIMAEVGLDSRRHGEENQACTLNWQIRTVYAAGCAGAFVFAWTDQWHRGGFDIEDWDFGITRRDRSAKPALRAVSQAFSEVPLRSANAMPRISVVVCSCNGARTIRECFEGLRKLEYPNYEVIVVNDGSTDSTPDLTKEYGFRLITTERRGLSCARNTGLEASTGEIVAYIDDDAYPDPHWLTYLANTFRQTDYVGVGGPNIPPPGGRMLADCVGNSPGGPIHVLLTDTDAEHIPGCNMAFRKEALQLIGGFDPQFVAAGDDVDVCWRLRARGWRLGFNPGAMVWHHRRNSVRAYWRQQVGYGKAEALLERKWPERYNAEGHVTWKGQVYGNGILHQLGRSGRIYQGTWGTALFQSIYEPAPSTLWELPVMPEWYLVNAALVALSLLGLLWKPLFCALLGLTFAVSLQLILAARKTSAAKFQTRAKSAFVYERLWSMTVILHLLQPLARLWGRLRSGLTPWRRHGTKKFVPPWARTFTSWSECWRSTEERLKALESALKKGGAIVLRGGDYDRWDMEIRGGTLGGVRLRMATEEHGAGKQLVRFRCWPRWSYLGVSVTSLLCLLAAGAMIDHAWAAGGVLAGAALLFATVSFRDCDAALGACVRALTQCAAEPVGVTEISTERLVAANVCYSVPQMERAAPIYLNGNGDGFKVTAPEASATENMAMNGNQFIPFHLPSIGEEEINEVTAVLRSGWLTTGARTAQFEKDFRAYVGAPHALAVNSCTAGLHLALAALGIGPGDEVITSPLTFCATVNVILHVGAIPVLADIGSDLNIDPDSIAARVTKRTRAVIPVHFAGLPCDMDEIWSLAQRRGLHVLEDAAHAVGAYYRQSPIGGASADTGARSDAVAFSFYATKNLTTGEGGMVTTHDKSLAERMRLLCLHGINKDAWNRYSERGNWYYEVLESGFKYNLSDLQSAVGLHQLRKLDAFIKVRKQYARMYQEALADVQEFELPPENASCRHAWHLYVLRLKLDRLKINRDEFIGQLRSRNIGASVHFIPIPLHPFFACYSNRSENQCPRALELYPRILSLPLYPGMNEEQVKYVAASVKQIVMAARKTGMVAMASSLGRAV